LEISTNGYYKGGTFCHFDGQQWGEADDRKARYNVAATFCNCLLEDKYESSSKNKVAKR
jgi:hypothetical protein